MEKQLGKMEKILIKQKKVATLVALLKETHFYMADSQGLSAGMMSELRNKCRAEQITCKMVKNSILRKALEQMFPDTAATFPSAPFLKGNTTLFITKGAPQQPGKLFIAFSKEKQTDKPELKAAYAHESFYIGAHHLVPLAALLSKEELLGELIARLHGKTSGLVASLQAGISAISVGLKGKGAEASNT